MKPDPNDPDYLKKVRLMAIYRRRNDGTYYSTAFFNMDLEPGDEMLDLMSQANEPCFTLKFTGIDNHQKELPADFQFPTDPKL